MNVRLTSKDRGEVGQPKLEPRASEELCRNQYDSKGSKCQKPPTPHPRNRYDSKGDESSFTDEYALDEFALPDEFAPDEFARVSCTQMSSPRMSSPHPVIQLFWDSCALLKLFWKKAPFAGNVGLGVARKGKDWQPLCQTLAIVFERTHRQAC